MNLRSSKKRYKNIEDHYDQITPLILYERTRIYDWGLVYVWLTKRKTGRKDVNKRISRPYVNKIYQQFSDN